MDSISASSTGFTFLRSSNKANSITSLSYYYLAISSRFNDPTSILVVNGKIYRYETSEIIGSSGYSTGFYSYNCSGCLGVYNTSAGFNTCISMTGFYANGAYETSIYISINVQSWSAKNFTIGLGNLQSSSNFDVIYYSVMIYTSDY